MPVDSMHPKGRLLDAAFEFPRLNLLDSHDFFDACAIRPGAGFV
jgi:hypothetical protein